MVAVTPATVRRAVRASFALFIWHLVGRGSRTFKTDPKHIGLAGHM